MPVKVLKSSFADFYTAEVLSNAKKQLLDDILALNLTIKVPHVPHDMSLRDQAVCLQAECMKAIFLCFWIW